MRSVAAVVIVMRQFRVLFAERLKTAQRNNARFPSVTPFCGQYSCPIIKDR